MTASRKRLLLCIAIIAIATVWMLFSTWGSWPDAIYDFGSQLYYPWQMSSGKHLYTDIAYFNGPLSQYFNAGMFRVFGVSLSTLIWVNLAILVGVIALIFHLVGRMNSQTDPLAPRSAGAQPRQSRGLMEGGALTATCACVVFVVVFAFSQYVGIGNYNWICPYTHEVTHGVALSLAMVAALDRAMRRNQRRGFLASGGLLGLVFLTKAEVFVPAVGAATVGLFLWIKATDASNRWSRLACFGVSAGVVVLLAFAALAVTLGPAVALRAMLGSWPWIFDRRIAQLQFYQQGLGIDDVSGNLWKMVVIGLSSAIVVISVVAVGLLPGRWRSMAVVLLSAELAMLLYSWQMVLQIARPWPVFLAIIAGISIKRAWHFNGADRSRWALRAMLSILALGLLGKMMLNARIWQYGFALAMPAATVLVDALIGWVPREISRRGGNERPIHLAGFTVIVCVVGCISANRFVGRPVRVGSGGDRFYPTSRGDEVVNAMKWIDYLVPPHGTCAVMPQGLMLNYLTRHADSIACVNLMPPEVVSTGESRIISQLNAHPPDLIVLSEKDIAHGAFTLTEGEYHYGKSIVSWVLSHYRRVIPANENSELKLSFWIKKGEG